MSEEKPDTKKIWIEFEVRDASVSNYKRLVLPPPNRFVHFGLTTKEVAELRELEKEAGK